MSLRVLREIIFVSMGDETLRHKIVFEPDEILPRYELTEEEYLALRLGDKQRLLKVGLDENMATYGAALFSRSR